MLRQVIEFNAVPFCVGGACFLLKRKLRVFFAGWLVTFLIFGFGAIYQASLRTSPIAKATSSARKIAQKSFSMRLTPPSANSADIVRTAPTPTRASEVAKMAFPSTVLVFIEDLNGQPLSIGSGFVLDTGAVVTNLHVIEGGARGHVKKINSDTKHAIDGFLRADVLHDLAVLSVPLSAPKLKLAGDSPVAVGDTVYAVGNPRGLEGTFSQGIISGIRRLDSDTIFQITAPISPGSSGACSEHRGEVIGIAVATFGDGQNLNFAVPSSYLERVAMLAKPAPLAKLGKKKTSSVLTAIGGRESTAGVTAGPLIWDNRAIPECSAFPLGTSWKASRITCLVIFYDTENKPLDFVLIRSPQFIPGDWQSACPATLIRA